MFMIRIFSISDLHVDYKQNSGWVRNLSDIEYQNDYLIVAGDITHNAVKLAKTLTLLSKKFQTVFFVPGNHDLWIRNKELKDSLEKFGLILNICTELGIAVEPRIINSSGSAYVLIQPLFSWYTKPEEGKDSLFLEKPGEDPSLSMWADNKAIKWPELKEVENITEFYINMNNLDLAQATRYDIISFSHFLPRQDLIFSLNGPPPQGSHFLDPAPKFNFSRVAGSTMIEKQIRKIGSKVHIYGHQHINRFRKTDNIVYIAHGLGYPRERQWRNIRDENYYPRLIWSSQKGFIYGEQN